LDRDLILIDEIVLPQTVNEAPAAHEDQVCCPFSVRTSIEHHRSKLVSSRRCGKATERLRPRGKEKGCSGVLASQHGFLFWISTVRSGRLIVDQLRRGSSSPVQVLSRHSGELDAEMYLGSIAESDDVRRAAGVASGVVICVDSSVQPGRNEPERVHSDGVQTSSRKRRPQLPLWWSPGSRSAARRPSRKSATSSSPAAGGRGAAGKRPPLHDRSAKLAYRRGRRKHSVRFERGDTGEGEVARADVAAVVVAALRSTGAIVQNACCTASAAKTRRSFGSHGRASRALNRR
jgi:hypothetical protein